MFSTYSKNPQHRCMQWRNGASETRSGTYLSVWLWGEGILFFAASWYLKRCLVVFQTMHCDTGLTSREVGRAQVRSILAPAGVSFTFDSSLSCRLSNDSYQTCSILCAVLDRRCVEFTAFPAICVVSEKKCSAAHSSTTKANQRPGRERCIVGAQAWWRHAAVNYKEMYWRF